MRGRDERRLEEMRVGRRSRGGERREEGGGEVRGDVEGEDSSKRCMEVT